MLNLHRKGSQSSSKNPPPGNQSCVKTSSLATTTTTTVTMVTTTTVTLTTTPPTLRRRHLTATVTSTLQPKLRPKKYPKLKLQKPQWQFLKSPQSRTTARKPPWWKPAPRNSPPANRPITGRWFQNRGEAPFLSTNQVGGTDFRGITFKCSVTSTGKT